jgi:lysozyme
MNLDFLREMLKHHEGLRLKPYRCSAGAWTIGYGWNISANKLPEDVESMLNMTGAITEEVAERLLNIGIDTAVRQCQAIFPKFDKFSDNRQIALVDFVYNVGAAGALKFKKMLAAVEVDDWNTAADELKDSDWFSQVGARAVEITAMVRQG